MKSKAIVLAALSLLYLSASASAPKLRKGNVDKVVAAMSIEEKVLTILGCGMVGAEDDRASLLTRPAILAGQASATHPNERLGIPSIALCDGPAGLHIDMTREGDDRVYYCTGFPVATCLASSWNLDLMYEVGRAMGNEALEYGADIMLAPAMNIQRSLLCGRNYEYYSEDPFLSGKLGAAMVRGIQSNGVGTSVKHFFAGGKETNSKNNDARASQRALREIYLRGFEICVKEAKPWTIMTSYNRVNGSYTSENPELLQTIVRDEWGYEGIFTTDWWAGRDVVAQVNAGNDFIAPGTDEQYYRMMAGIEEGSISMAQVDANVKRILLTIMKSPKYSGYRPSYAPDIEEHAQVTRQSATEGMVLLENKDNSLPISPEVKSLGLFGNASYEFIPGGTGSGDVNRAYTVDIFQGLSEAGYKLQPSLTERYQSYIAYEREHEEKRHVFYGKKHLEELYLEPSYIREIASVTDMGIFTIGRQSGEMGDRSVTDDFNLSTEEKALLRKICNAYHELGKRVVVVLNIGGVIETASWKDMPDAILLAWQPGQEGGHSVADVLSGEANPSGHLAVTFPMDYFDSPAAVNYSYQKLSEDTFLPGQVPVYGDEPRLNWNYIEYEEDIYVGYRYYDSFGRAVSYPFGYGLSYTDFSYSAPSLRAVEDGFEVSVTVTNSGSVAGKDVVQLYVAAPIVALEHPDKELRAFAKTGLLEPGQSETLTLCFKTADLASFSEESSAWVTFAGDYEALLARSATEIIASLPFTVDEEMERKCSDVLRPRTELHLLSRTNN